MLGHMNYNLGKCLLPGWRSSVNVLNVGMIFAYNKKICLISYRQILKTICYIAVYIPIGLSYKDMY